jgi:tRNA G18 (ribose-2'-O)-methylase SpoU
MAETRNIIDHYHYWNHEAIMADLDSKRNNFTVICANVENDFNISTVIRNSNAFLANEVWIYGRKQYDRRGTVGTHLYTKFRHVKTIDNLVEELNSLKERAGGNIHVVGIDNISNSSNITNFSWGNDSNAHVVMIFGQEQIGIPKELIDICDDVVYIPQYGSVRSLNVGTASGIAMYDYCTKVVDTVNSM